MSDSLNDQPCLKPKSLRLAFSKAADMPRIEKILDPGVKAAFDPDNHVAKRLNASFNKAVADGCTAMLVDEKDDVKTLTMAYHVHVDKSPAPDAAHDHINFGTSLSLIPGYKSASVVIAALALREWLLHPPVQTISAGIVPENAPSLKTYVEGLGWAPEKDASAVKSIATATWRTLADPADSSGNTCLEKPPADLENVGWYVCDDVALKKQARVLLDCLDRGGVASKKGDVIPVDFSALDDIGLTRPCLEAIASGVTSRKALAKMARHAP